MGLFSTSECSTKKMIDLCEESEKFEAMKQILKAHVRRKIGPIATLDKIPLVDVLSKTLSDKIVRRILCQIAAGEVEDPGNISAVADPSVVKYLIQGEH